MPKTNGEMETTEYSLDLLEETVQALDDSENTSQIPFYKCPKCSEILSSYAELADHVSSIHHELKTISTLSGDECPMKFTEEKPLDNHKRALQNVTCIGKDELYLKSKNDLSDRFKERYVFKCVHCHRNLMSEQKLKKHISAKHDTQCNICGKTFKNVNSKKTHEAYHHQKHKEVCWICGTILKSKQSLNHHMRIHNAKLYRCDVCKKLFSTASTLHAHMSTHILINGKREKNYLCEFCPKKFHKLYLLKTHSLVHKGEKPYNCGMCGKGFNCKANLQKHEKTRILRGICPTKVTKERISSSDLPRPTKDCDICRRKFIRPINVKKHRKYHFCDGDPEIIQKLLNEPEERPCRFCNKVILSKVAYLQHMAQHTGSKRPLCCEFCGKTSSQYKQYLIHERTHTGEKPFKCNCCDSRFCDQNTMRSHEAGHSDHKSHVCEICQKTFKLRVNLLQHTITHKGSSSFRPYSCPTCNRGYITKGHLQKHIRTAGCSAEQPDNFLCSECGRNFSCKVYLKKHMARVHKEKGKKATGPREVVEDEEPCTTLEFLSTLENGKDVNDLQGLPFIISPVEYIVEES